MKTIIAVFAALALYASNAHAACAGITSIERSSETIGPEEQIRTLAVVAPEGCVWDVAPTAWWIEIVSKPASGGGTLTYRVKANPFSALRAAEIWVSQFPLSVNQNAAATAKPFRGDINGDGFADAFYRDSEKSYRVSWGGRSSMSEDVVRRGDAGMVVALGSFVGDGHAGYALYDPISLQVNVALLNELGSPTIVPVRQIVSTRWEIMGAGDFDGDAKSDLLLRNTEEGLLSIWFMNGGTLREAPLVDTRIVNPAWRIAGIEDFDHDGKHDILFRNVVTGGLSVWKMNGSHVVSTADVASKALPWIILGTGDFNGDGWMDLLYRHSVTGAIEYHLMQNFAVTSVVPHPEGVAAAQRVVAVADINGDGRDDVLFRSQNVAVETSRSYRTMSAVGSVSLSWTGPWGFLAPRYRRPAAVSDFNGDGRSDLLLRHATYDEVATWEMRGPSVVRDTAFARVSSPAWQFKQFAPFSGDLMSDIALVNNSGGGTTLAMWELAGQRVLNADEVGNASGRSLLGTGDFDDDGNADLLLQYAATRELEVWLMAGHTVRSRTIVGTPEIDETFDCIGDFDTDGFPDVVLRNPSGAYIAWFMAGAARRERRILGTLNPAWKTLAAFDRFGDGVYRILQRSPNTDEVAIATYTGTGMQGTLAGGAGPGGRYQAIGDYNGDGATGEIIIRNASTGAVTMWSLAGFGGYDKVTFAYVASPLWEFQGAFEPTPTNTSQAADERAVAGPSLAPLHVESSTSEPVQ